MSQPKRKLTKAGVALTADARHKLQELANWIEREELMGQQDPQVTLSFAGSVTTDHRITRVSPVGALCQMYQPFKKADAKLVMHGLWLINWAQATSRAATLLGISEADFQILWRFWYAEGTRPLRIVAQLRKLK